MFKTNESYQEACVLTMVVTRVNSVLDESQDLVFTRSSLKC